MWGGRKERPLTVWSLRTHYTKRPDEYSITNDCFFADLWLLWFSTASFSALEYPSMEEYDAREEGTRMSHNRQLE